MDEGKGVCALCKGKAEPAEVDHIVAVWCGGGNERSNLRVLCMGCHKEKTKTDIKMAAKASRIQKKQAGIWRPNRRKIGDPRLKRKITGEVVRRDADDEEGK